MNKQDYLIYLTDKYQQIDTLDEATCSFATTQSISESVGKKSNVVNHHLNNLFKEKELIKINTKPVYFIPVSILPKLIGSFPEKEMYDSFEELLEESGESDVLEQLIGSKHSLKTVLKQGKIALSYPPKGMPFLLTGPTGSGKTYLVKQFYQYAVDTSLLEKDAPFSIFNCAEYADNPELLSSKLFGYKKGSFTGADRDQKGLLELSDGGLLFIDEVHRLSPESQEKLFYFIDEGRFKPLGENEHWKQAEVRLMFATTENIGDYLLDTFTRRIPIVAKVPSLDERGTKEKREFLYYFLKQEAKQIGKNLKIEKNLFTFMITYQFKGNVGELANLVRYICGNAYVRQLDEDELTISITDLPERLKKQAVQLVDLYNKEVLEIKTTGQVIDPGYFSQRDMLEQMYDELRLIGDVMLKGNLSFSRWLNGSFEEIERHLDKFKEDILIDKILEVKLQYLIDEVTQIMYESHQIEILPEIKTIVLTYLELLISQDQASDYELKEPIAYNRIYLEKMPYINKQVGLFVYLLNEISDLSDIYFTEWDYFVLQTILSYYNRLKHKDQINGVVICHGSSTASSIAETANIMIGQKVYQGIDMSLEVSFKEIIKKLQRYLSLHETGNGTIILIDIGHTQDLKEALQDRLDGPIAIIDNVSTKLALDVGFKIINRENIEYIVEEATRHHVSQYALFEPDKKRPPALIISCQTGMGTAKKLQEVMNEHLPKDLNLELVTTDYQHLKKMKNNTTMFSRYDIIGIFGTTDPHVESVPYIGLDDVMSQDGLKHLTRIFGQYLSTEEIQGLNNGMMKTLSLENLVTMLSILNPEKTIELISEMIDYWELTFKIKIPNNLKTALYIHISCMIERVITRTYVEDEHIDRELFIQEHSFFIQTIKKGLETFESVYHVEVDLGEIAYLHQLFQLNLIGFAY